MAAETYNITRTFHTTVGTGWFQVEKDITLSITFAATTYSEVDVTDEFNHLAQTVINDWASAHPSLTTIFTKNTTPFLERWLCQYVNTPRVQVKRATVNTVGPRKYISETEQKPEPPHTHITKALNNKLDLTLHFREFSNRIRTEHPELWENGCTDGARLDSALEQIKGQLIGRLDPVRTPIWKK